MSQVTTQTKPAAHAGGTAGIEHVDVLIVGAGIAGIGSAHHLQEQCPEKSFLILETLESYGGTWLTHTYPGIRSDSDLYTFGYRFKPWIGPPIATAQQILDYMGEVIDESNLAPHIRYRHRISSASWSSADRLWTVVVTDLATGVVHRVTANFLWMCQGYYRHAEGYTPEWPGMDRFTGQIVHPQTWPEDLDLAGKRVIVIGSGATAATLVPAIAGTCEHVTLLQRSPTYFVPRNNADEIADLLRTLEIPEEWIHEIIRRKVLFDQAEVTRLSFEEPELVKEVLLQGVRDYLGPDFDIDTHFTPTYRPWQQRIAVVPDGDLFKGITAGLASVVTDHIETFTENGILLKSGQELEADIIVTATGFNIAILGDIAFTIDDEPLVLSDTVTYRGMMFTGVPNLLWVFGYFRASWTLRVDLIGDFVARLFKHMDELGVSVVTPQLLPEEAHEPQLPWMDPDNFSPGYLQRGMHLLPKRLDKAEWMHTQDYWVEKTELPAADLDDGRLEYR